jgi:hypothetical protein
MYFSSRALASISQPQMPEGAPETPPLSFRSARAVLVSKSSPDYGVHLPCAPPELSFPGVILLSGCQGERQLRERNMHGLIYLIGLIVVILFILSLLGLR